METWPSESQIVPVMLHGAKLAQDFARDLFDEGIYAVGFFFSVAARGQARIRTQLSAAHEKHHLCAAIVAFIVTRRYFRFQFIRPDRADGFKRQPAPGPRFALTKARR